VEVTDFVEMLEHLRGEKGLPKTSKNTLENESSPSGFGDLGCVPARDHMLYCLILTGQRVPCSGRKEIKVAVIGLACVVSL
jgi:hypothetical protein